MASEASSGGSTNKFDYSGVKKVYNDIITHTDAVKELLIEIDDEYRARVGIKDQAIFGACADVLIPF